MTTTLSSYQQATTASILATALMPPAPDGPRIDYLPVAVRGYMAPLPTTRPPAPAPDPDARPDYTRPVLIIDTETTIDETQALQFGAYRYCRQHPDGRLITMEEGLFYADELPDRDPTGLETLRTYARSQRPDITPTVAGRLADARPELRLMSRRQFVNTVLWPAAARARATVVGFNLPFDLSRLAVHAGEARGGNAGGFSFQLWDYQGKNHQYRPWITIRSLDSKRARIAFTRVGNDDDGDLTEPNGTAFRGNFLDLRTLAFALTNDSHSLASACATFNVTDTKTPTVEHGQITEDYIGYCRQDVRATAGLYEKLIAAYQQHPIALEPTKAYSPASIAKAYLRAMNIRPPLEQNPHLDPDLIGAAMSAFYGGRSECRIRRTPVPVTVVDFTAMYPTVNALMNSWQLLTAQRITEDDVTDEIRELTATISLEDCFKPELWPWLIGIAEIEPDGDILPVRARYGSNDEWVIGVNPLHQGPIRHTLWYSLADIIASTLLSGRPPKILRAIRYQPNGHSSDLFTTELHSKVPVDPSTDDFFRRIIEERQRLRATGTPEDATVAGFLKVFANSGSYGIFAELNRTEQPEKKRQTRTIQGGKTMFTCRPDATEEPGNYCFPPLAAAITGAARLMLALLERSVTDAGGAWAFADTDSMAIVQTPHGGPISCPGGPAAGLDGTPAIRALNDGELAGIRSRFETLNPYDQTDGAFPLLKVEHRATCFAISAKRYALYQPAPDGAVHDIVKVSEHGLGHLLDPSDSEADQVPWIQQTWTWLINDHQIGRAAIEPSWLGAPAASRTTISSPASWRPFEAANGGVSYAGKIKPFNFLSVAFPTPLQLPPGLNPRRFRLIAPYGTCARASVGQAWHDLYNPGITYRLHTEPDVGVLPPDGHVPAKSYRDIVQQHGRQPENKTLDGAGRTCGRSSKGLLARRPTGIATVRHIGKEAHRLDDARAGLVADASEVTADFGDATDQELALALAILAGQATANLAVQLRCSDRRLRDIRLGHSRPRPTTRATLLELARASAAVPPLLMGGSHPAGGMSRRASVVLDHNPPEHGDGHGNMKGPDNAIAARGEDLPAQSPRTYGGADFPSGARRRSESLGHRPLDASLPQR